MLPSKITKQIQVIASPGSEFRSGDYLLVQVLKRLIGDKWAIGYKGKVFSAISEVELKPGEKILTQVIRSGKKLILQIKDSSNDTPSDTGTRHASPLMAASGLLIKSLLRASINLRPEILAKIGKIYQDLKRNNQGREARIAGAIARLLDKQIDPSCRGFAAIVKILSLLSGDENNGRRKDRWSEKEEDLREWIKKISDINSADNEENGNPLQVFNHLKALNESWVVIPYRFIARGVIYQGLIKLLLDTNQ